MTLIDPTAIGRFVSTLFRNCTSDGALCLYVFSHNQSERAIAQQWAAPSDTAAPVRLAQQAATHPQPAVFCPPVALFGPLTNEAGKRTTAERNVLEAPVITLELDANPADGRLMAESVLGPATLAVASGGLTSDGSAKLHLYWRLATPARTPEERAELTRVRKLLAAWAGGDASGAPICHPMRWPGSVHRKAAARLATIVSETDRDVVLADALALLTPMVPDLAAARTVVSLTGDPLPSGEAMRLAVAIPNDGPANWAEWSRIGMAFFAATHGSDEGEEAFMAWSARNPAHDPDEVSSRWGHWHNSPPTQLTAGTLYHAAGETRGPAPDASAVFSEPASLPERALSEPPSVTQQRVEQAVARITGNELRNGKLLSPEEQMAFFKGCVYVRSLDQVLIPNGELLNQSRFDVEYGGYKFQTDDGTGTPSKSAWEGFLKNHRFVPLKATALCFRPEIPPGAIIPEGSQTLVNIYVPIETPRTAGDPAPFLTHMGKLFPDDRDRRILLSYMASVVQNPGFKAQWWPVIQGVEGNGKSMLLDVMQFAIGAQYCHLPNAAKMTRNGINFNGWMRGKLFLGMEEVYSANRREFLEEFKPYVTNRRLPIEGKGIDEVTGDNRANGLILTNHEEGVPINDNNRRYAPFFTPQQSPEDNERDGLTSRYFVDLWAWFRGEGKYRKHGADYGFRVVNDYLRTYACEEEFDPRQLATRAPRTSTTERAVRVSLGTAEQEILAACEEGRPGFAGGWVSSKALDNLLDQIRARVPRNKRRGLMQSIGYDWHAALPDGRATGVVPPDNVRCRLYLTKDHLARNIDDPAAIVRAYTKAQGASAAEQAEAALNR